MGIILGSVSFRGRFGDHFRVGDHFGVGIISGAVQIAEKKKTSAIIAIIWNHSPAMAAIAATTISAIVLASIAGEWFPYDRWTFFLSDGSGHAAIVAIIWKPRFYRNNQSPFLLNCNLYALQTCPTHPSKLRLLLVYVIFDIMSSHVSGMIGLINKTKGLRFCNVSGFLELYNDPQVRLTAINSQSFHSKYPWLLIDYCWLIICLAIIKKKKFNHRRQTSSFLLKGSWQGWLKRWVNYHYDRKYKKWRLLEPSYCFF